MLPKIARFARHPLTAPSPKGPVESGFRAGLQQVPGLRDLDGSGFQGGKVWSSTLGAQDRKRGKGDILSFRFRLFEFESCTNQCMRSVVPLSKQYRQVGLVYGGFDG